MIPRQTLHSHLPVDHSPQPAATSATASRLPLKRCTSHCRCRTGAARTQRSSLAEPEHAAAQVAGRRRGRPREASVQRSRLQGSRGSRHLGGCRHSWVVLGRQSWGSGSRSADMESRKVLLLSDIFEKEREHTLRCAFLKLPNSQSPFFTCMSAKPVPWGTTSSCTHTRNKPPNCGFKRIPSRTYPRTRSIASASPSGAEHAAISAARSFERSSRM